jgi:hypothetical protein
MATPTPETNHNLLQWIIGGGLTTVVSGFLIWFNDRRKTALTERQTTLADIKSRVDSIETARKEAREEYIAEKAMMQLQISELNNKLDHAQHEAFKREIAHKEEIQTWMIKLMDQERNHQAEKQEWLTSITELKIENKELRMKFEQLEAKSYARTN